MASKTKATQPEDKGEVPETETSAPDTPLRLFGLPDAVCKMIKAAKARSYVSHKQINSVLPSEEVTSEQIEDILAMLNEVGVNIVDSDEAEPEEEVELREEPEEESEGGALVEVQRAAPAKIGKAEPFERTDDPVRMYLREMGLVELLSREGEIAVAKRIEAGREAMIAGLCESPLTFQAITIWRDELKDGQIFLGDIIDLEATYAGPITKTVPGGVPGVGGAAEAPTGATPFLQVVPPRPAAPASVPSAVTPFRLKPQNRDSEEQPEQGVPGESDLDGDDVENSMSLAAIEAELKPKVLEAFDTIADTYKRLRRLQDQDIEHRLKNELLSPAQERKYKKLKKELIAEVKSLCLKQARIDALVEQLYDINRRLVSYEGRLMRIAESHYVTREISSSTTRAPSSTRAGSTASPSFRPRAGRTSSPRTRIGSNRSARRSMRSQARPGSRSGNCAGSSGWCRRVSSRRARPRKRWWRRTCGSSSRSPRNTPIAARCSSTSSRKATSA
jgi:RNA polymerase primary sigma factor